MKDIRKSLLDNSTQSLSLDVPQHRNSIAVEEEDRMESSSLKSPSEIIMTKEQKLEQLREQLHKRKQLQQESGLKLMKTGPRGKDFYLQKVSHFLLSSFFLAIASQQIFIYLYLHDYVNGYFHNRTSMLGGWIEGGNYTLLSFFVGRLFGYLISAWLIIKPIQEDEEIGRKIFSICLMLAAGSSFLSAKILPQRDFGMFCLFYVALPVFFTCKF